MVNKKETFLYKYKSPVFVKQNLNIVFIYKQVSFNILYIWQNNLIVCLQNKKLFCFKTVIQKYNFFYFENSITNFYGLKEKYYCSKLTIIGLGFKYFVYKKHLFLLTGLSHYLLYKIPLDIKVICKKKNLFLLSYNKQKLFLFKTLIQKSKKYNLYKGKGILHFKQFKNFIKLKKGKKQQYM